MKQKTTRIKTLVGALVMLLGTTTTLHGQTVLYEENLGTPTSNTTIQNYTGWQNSSVIYTGNGTCDIRSSNASSGYGGASGGGNVMINDTLKWFQISGLNTSSTLPTVNLYCGLRKTTAENGSNFRVEFSTDSMVWVHLPMQDTLPTGTGTGKWYRVCFPNVPAHPYLHLRFSNLANVDYRLDDISIVDGAEVVLETVATPTVTPAGGTYYEGQQVTIECATDGASVYYTLDGSTPNEQSNLYLGILNINSSCTLKAFAKKENMYNSQVLTVQYTILDTNSLVALPFDISGNSDSTHLDIKLMDGFRSYKLGSSYANGSVKFESKNAGSAMLTAHLDSSPDTLFFDLKGVKGGSPSSYNGITFIVSESADGTQWSTVATLNETDISTESFSHLGPYTLSTETRYIRWLLATAGSGNTQLNNIVITKRSDTGDDHGDNDDEEGDGDGEGDGAGIDNPTNPSDPTPYPNPTSNTFQWNLCEEGVVVSLYDLTGQLIQQWENVPNGANLEISGIAAGIYIIQATSNAGKITKKLIIK